MVIWVQLLFKITWLNNNFEAETRLCYIQICVIMRTLSNFEVLTYDPLIYIMIILYFMLNWVKYSMVEYINPLYSGNP